MFYELYSAFKQKLNPIFVKLQLIILKKRISGT